MKSLECNLHCTSWCIQNNWFLAIQRYGCIYPCNTSISTGGFDVFFESQTFQFLKSMYLFWHIIINPVATSQKDNPTMSFSTRSAHIILGKNRVALPEIESNRWSNIESILGFLYRESISSPESVAYTWKCDWTSDDQMSPDVCHIPLPNRQCKPVPGIACIPCAILCIFFSSLQPSGLCSADASDNTFCNSHCVSFQNSPFGPSSVRLGAFY